ncbi:MAG: nucleotidyl transferase AbiEii/AbiGii toxin family protein [Chloroflexota bacterium]
MANNPEFYFDILYPFQDRVIRVINQVETGFYLTGGTAASRGYLQHRLSDDLDYFVNDDNRFGLWVERLIQALNQEWECEVLTKEERFARLTLSQDETLLKIELINDVPARVGEIRNHATLGRLDSAGNILANKVTALLDREEPKDLADIWGFCCQLDLSLQIAITDAQSKAAGVFPADLARILCSVKRTDWESIRWINAPPVETFIAQLTQLGESLLLTRP